MNTSHQIDQLAERIKPLDPVGPTRPARPVKPKRERPDGSDVPQPKNKKKRIKRKDSDPDSSGIDVYATPPLGVEILIKGQRIQKQGSEQW